MAEAAIVPAINIGVHARESLAITLTPGLGPTRSRRLVELRGRIEAVVRATLTELEATGIRTVSAQSLGTGRSLELAHVKQIKASASGRTATRLR